MGSQDAPPNIFFDGYCSTVQGLLDWFEVDLGFTRAFIYSNWFVCCVCFCCLLPRLTLLLSCLDILHCLPRAVGVPLESALNLVSPMRPCGAHNTHTCCARRSLALFVMIELMIQVLIHILVYLNTQNRGVGQAETFWSMARTYNDCAHTHMFTYTLEM